MFALQRIGQAKENKLDHHFGSEEFGGSDSAFWDDSNRHGRLRRSTSFESILEATKHMDHEPAVTKVVCSMRNLMLQTKSNPSSISNKQSFGVAHPRQEQPVQPKGSVIVGSKSHTLLQSKNTFATTSNKSFNALDQLSHARKATSYKIDNSGEFKYPTPKKTENNMLLNLIDKKHEKRVSMEKENGLLNSSSQEHKESDEVAGHNHVQQNSNEERRPTTYLLRQQSDSSLFFGSRKAAVQVEAKPDHRVYLQLNNSEHSLHQRRSRRRFGVQKSDWIKGDKVIPTSLAVKRAGSDPTLEKRSRRTTTTRKSGDTLHHLGHRILHQKSWQLLSSNTATTNIDRGVHTRGRRIVIGLSKGEDDDDMHNVATEQPKRKRRPRMDMAERGNSSSRSSLNFDGDNHSGCDDRGDRKTSNDASFTLLETTSIEDKLQTSDHSIDILEETSHNILNETRHRSSTHKPRTEKETTGTRHGMRKASSDKEARMRKPGTKSHPESVDTLASSRRDKLESLKHKLRVRKDEQILSAFELRGHASCNFETNPAGCHGHDRNHFSFHFGDDFNFSLSEKQDEVFHSNEKADGNNKKSSTLAGETASLIKQINTLDFPIPVPTDGEDGQLGNRKSNSNRTVSSKTPKRSRRTFSSLVRPSSKKSLSRASTKKTEPNDSLSSLSLGLSSRSLDDSF
ncbi:hypothetical protein FisN_32Hh066 [Fistulifera solaris]|uniref:Uncharacterized protein n=1 Tax=Fistulifera solaris TaxID=1519565 RepID=A0A1Z5K353_FISSO|nr:hypothetical protein FisN_32Hh066 [Fistulifera solaris]|eukprot:GAX20677.1 hypothetical protein FisN_32Hh066 [Fistulifera solaris]